MGPSSDTQRAGFSCNRAGSGRGFIWACLDLFRPEPAFVFAITGIRVDQRGSASGICSGFADKISETPAAIHQTGAFLTFSVSSGKCSLSVFVLVPADVLCYTLC